MEDKLSRFYELKMMQKSIEEELSGLRDELLRKYPNPIQVELDPYLLKVSYQERRQYDDQALYNVLPDASLWRLMSKADTSKIAGLLKLNIIAEELLNGTYKTVQVPYLQVQKR